MFLKNIFHFLNMIQNKDEILYNYLLYHHNEKILFLT
jgi:hypothetical protein